MRLFSSKLVISTVVSNYDNSFYFLSPMQQIYNEAMQIETMLINKIDIANNENEIDNALNSTNLNRVNQKIIKNNQKRSENKFLHKVYLIKDIMQDEGCSRRNIRNDYKT